MISVYDHGSIHSYLQAVFDFKKARRPRLSLRQFAGQIGFPDSGSLSRVLKGTRAITLTSAQKISTALELTGNERLYFFQLVLLQNATDDLKIPLLENLKQLVAKRHFLESNVDENIHALADHRLLAIRECLRMKESLHQIDRLKKSWKADDQAPDLFEALDKLKQFGLVIEQNQKLKPSSSSYIYSPQKSSEAVRHYHSGWLGSAHHALTHLPVDERYFLGSTVAVRSDVYKEVVEQLDLLHQKILSLAADEQADQVLHIGSFAIPVTGRNS